MLDSREPSPPQDYVPHAKAFGNKNVASSTFLSNHNKINFTINVNNTISITSITLQCVYLLATH